jgi:hypothetical protein
MNKEQIINRLTMADNWLHLTDRQRGDVAAVLADDEAPDWVREIENASEDVVLGALVYRDGRVRLQCAAKRADGVTDHAWVAETLRRLADTQDAKAT